MDDMEIMSGLALLGRELVRQQRLARLHVGEANRLLGDVETTGRLPRDREARTRQVARLRKIGAEVRAARILALAGRERNQPADLDERAQIEPIMPGHIEGAPSSASPVASSSASMASSVAIPRSRPPRSRTTPTSSHMVSSSRSRRSFKFPPLRANGWSAR